MADEEYPYPSDLDSDGGYGSDQYSDNDDMDMLADNLSFVTLVAPSPVPLKPRARSYSSSSSLTLATGTGTPAGMCVVCETRPSYYNARTGRSYPTCGPKCAARQQQGVPAKVGRSSEPMVPARSGNYSNRGTPHSDRRVVNDPRLTPNRKVYSQVFPGKPKLACVICKTRSAHVKYLTCGLQCAEKLCKDGGDPTMCDYCHRKPRIAGKNQCDPTCEAKSKIACLLCKCRPKNGVGFHLCGKTCKRIATKSTPLVLEAPKGHKTYEMVEKRFKKAWHNVTVQLPTIKRIFKIIENDSFLRPYAEYKRLKGNEQFRYHGTGRQCQLGVSTTQLCSSTTCPVCNILKTSFKISLARPSGAFGAGVYLSSAPNKAYNYTGGNGALLLTKVVLGNVKEVKNFAEVTSCPEGYDSVVYDRYNGHLNETVVYKDEAVRPVFLIMF